LVLVIHQVLFRTAWIFKTESVIMPAFLDSITDAGWVRGMLPPLNRFSQSIAPLMHADRLSAAPVKSRWLQRTTLLMGVPFLSLGLMLLYFGGETPDWFPFAFLSAYAIFFSVHGVNQSTFSTIQGKLILPHRRGRLMAIAGYFGSPMAVTMALLLMKPWTQHNPPLFSRIFLFTGSVFVLASLVARFIVEQPDPSGKAVARRRHVRDSLARLKNDSTLRKLCIIAALFVTSQLLFPHYQRIGREQPGYSGSMLMIWVVAQNLGAAGFSWISGLLADRFGTRSALRFTIFGAIFAPLLPLVLRNYADAEWYWVTFVWLGLVPVTYRVQLNYVLEITERSQHPIYVSTVVLCMAPPIVLSPLVGELVARFGYIGPFCSISAVVFIAWLMTLTMTEPRSPDFCPAKAVE
jgi:predicted MFS family arabinose efflux permease